MTILAAFVWPGLFAAGAGAISIPILIHIIARRRFRRIRWAATAFLLQAVRRNRRRVWLEDLILMLLRCLAVLLIGLLVARPFFRPEGLAAVLGGSDRSERIFIVDDSFSMGYQSGEDSSFARAKRAVTRLIELVRQQSPGDTVTVLRTSDIDTAVAAGVFLDDEQTTELLSRVEGMKVSRQALSANDIFVSVRRMLDEQPRTVSATVYMVSDFQRRDWAPKNVESISVPSGESKERASAIAPLAGWRHEKRGLKLVLVDVGDDAAGNVAVTELASQRSRFVAGVGADVAVNVTNYAEEPTEKLDLEVNVGPSAQPSVVVGRVGGNEDVQIPIAVTAERPGWQWVRVATRADRLPIDDSRTLVVEVVDAVRILIVNGEPSSDAYRDEATLLSTALRPAGEVFSGNEVTVIDETELDDTNLEPFDAVVLANVFRPSTMSVESLTTFTRAGGGVAFFLGDQVDAEVYNETLYDQGRGLLPVSLREQRTAPVGGVRLVADDPSHPVVRIFSGADNPFVKQIAFHKFFACALPSQDALEAKSVNRAVQIAHFSDGDQSPAWIEKPFGDGRVVVFASSCDQEWNDWAKDPSYVVAMLELAQHLARGRGTSTETLVGDPIDFAVDPATYEPDVRLRTPGYPAEQEISLTALPAEDGQGLRVRWEQTRVDGVYRFHLTNKNGAEDVRAVAVNVDPTESNLAAADEAALRASLHEMPVTYVDGLSALDSVDADTRRELWKSVLLAAMAILMCEQFLAWWFGRQV